MTKKRRGYAVDINTDRRMKIQTFSILAGTEVCNARCPFCISKMTPLNGINPKVPPFKAHRFLQACSFAKSTGVSTVMITGKGEPTLYPDQITEYFSYLKDFNFGMTELQTNGAQIQAHKEQFEPLLRQWQEAGLTTVAISIVSADPEENRKIYFPKRNSYYDLPDLIKFLHSLDITVRLTVTVTKASMRSLEEFKNLVEFATLHKVEQLTFRPVNAPTQTYVDDEVFKWTTDNFCNPEFFQEITDYVSQNGTMLLKLMHGATVYDLNGQNICLTNCLTRSDDQEQIRQIIYFPDGKLRYDWEHAGAILF